MMLWAGWERQGLQLGNGLRREGATCFWKTSSKKTLISVHNVSGLGFGGSRPLEAPHCHLFDLMFKCLKLSVSV